MEQWRWYSWCHYHNNCSNISLKSWKEKWKERVHQHVFADFNSFFVWIALTWITMSMVGYGMYNENFRQSWDWRALEKQVRTKRNGNWKILFKLLSKITTTCMWN